MQSESELWARARQMREQHGKAALAVAEKYMDEMLAADDRSRYWEWSQISTMLGKLRTTRRR